MRRTLATGQTLRATLVLALTLAGCANKRTLESVTDSSSVETQGGLTATRIPGTAAGSGSSDPKERPLSRGAARLASTFAPQGRPLFAPVHWKFDAAGRKDLPVKLSAGMRVTFVAYAQPSDIDLDLVLTRPDGLTVAEDSSPDEMPVVAGFEVKSDGTYNLRAVADGAGEALLMGFEAAPGPESAAAAELAKLAQRYLPGAMALSPVHRESLLPGHAARLPFAMLAGRCYGVVAVGSPALRDLDLYWSTAEHDELEEDTGPSPDVVIPDLCATHAGMTTVTLRAAEGSGDAFWQVFEHPKRAARAAASGSGGAEK